MDKSKTILGLELINYQLNKSKIPVYLDTMI